MGLLSKTLRVPRSERQELYLLGYREGYNDHAKSKAYAEAVYGKYPDGEPTLKDNGDGTITVTLKNYGGVQLTLGGDG